MIILDTDVLIEVLDKQSDKGEEALNKIKEKNEEISTTAINLHELIYGIYKKGKTGIIKSILELTTFDFTREDATLSAKMEFELEKIGEKIARLDCMIASIAINNNCQLFTFNITHFIRFKKYGLKLF